MREIAFWQAINEGLAEEMARDETVFLMGECLRGGLFGTTNGLVNRFGKERVLDTAISECVIGGAPVGAAIAGYRPVADLMFSDFFLIAADEMCNKAAKWRFCHGGKAKLPIVYMSSTGGYMGSDAEHSQCNESLIMHTPGLKLVLPSTAYDAKGLLKTAIRDDNPVVFLYHKQLLGIKGNVPEEEYTIPFGVADIKRKGNDVTVVATGYMVSMVMNVANHVQQKGVSVEVIDPRTLEPLDIETIVASVKKTGRVIIVDEDTKRCGVTGEIAMQIMEHAFDSLDAPIKRIAAANFPIPANKSLEAHVMPQVNDIVAAIQAVTGKDLGGPMPAAEVMDFRAVTSALGVSKKM
jgi:acetoin:2,6-dichlorophenolindophenol oxidoreductase subunit beta